VEINALGLIETKGFVSAVEAADAALKAADVRLLGYELAKGQGLITIKLEGNVAAVATAVSAASSAVIKVGVLVSTHVIPKPHENINMFFGSKKTKEIEKNAAESWAVSTEEIAERVIANDNTEASLDAHGLATCNLCKEPNCPRKKGEPRSMCIHNLRD
jgi:microcompartment protein CcmL/EutN